MNTPTAFNPRLRRFKRLHRAVLITLATMALAACGGGGMDDEALTSPASAAGQPLRAGATAASTVTMTKVHFTNADGQALTGFLFSDPTAPQRNAAVVMMHGCAGVWSNGVESTEAQPSIKALSHIHKRWGKTWPGRASPACWWTASRRGASSMSATTAAPASMKPPCAPRTPWRAGPGWSPMAM